MLEKIIDEQKTGAEGRTSMAIYNNNLWSYWQFTPQPTPHRFNSTPPKIH